MKLTNQEGEIPKECHSNQGRVSCPSPVTAFLSAPPFPSASLVIDEADICSRTRTLTRPCAPSAWACAPPPRWSTSAPPYPEEVHRKLLTALPPGAASLVGPSLHRTASGLQEVQYCTVLYCLSTVL